MFLLARSLPLALAATEMGEEEEEDREDMAGDTGTNRRARSAEEEADQATVEEEDTAEEEAEAEVEDGDTRFASLQQGIGQAARVNVILVRVTRMLRALRLSLF